MRSTPQLIARATLMALLVLAVMFTAGCTASVADAQGPYPYPGPSATPAPEGPTATTAPAGPTATAAPVLPTQAPVVPTPVPTPRPNLPDSSGGSLPLAFAAAMLALAGAVAVARRRAS